MFNLIEELFSPGRKHTEDERRRLEHTRVEEGSNDPGQGPIDLSSGHVLIRPRGEQPAETKESAADADPGDETGTDNKGDGSR